MAQRRANEARNAKKNEASDGDEKSMFVGVRIRPLSEKEKESRQHSCCQVIDGTVVAIKKDGNASEYLKSQAASLHEYGFDAAFPESTTQYEVYEGTTKPYLQHVLRGINVTVFAYGATGAGKTHTLMGNARCDESAAHAEAGIIPNAICDLFERIEEKRRNAAVGESWTVFMNYIEVYNEQVYDLLEGSKKVLAVREDPERGVVVVAGVTEKDVLDAEEVLELLQFGNKNRATEATMANSVSSRSHAVLQVTIKYAQRTERGGERTQEAKLSLIDLAGSERASATNNRGVRLQEGASINKSLLALANCINALAAPGKVNVKYRDSKLTHLLKSSLEGNCKLIMIANVNPSNATFEDSHNTLKYANRAKNIKLNPTVTAKSGSDGTWLERETRLRSENSELRAKVAFLEGLVEDLRAQLGSVGGGGSSSSAAAAAPKGHQHQQQHQQEAAVEVIRAHSPTVARQIKHERINHARRRSSAHIPSQDEVVGEETRTRVRKNRASMCAEVLTTLLELPTNSKGKSNNSKANGRNSSIGDRRNSCDTSMDEGLDENDDACEELPAASSQRNHNGRSHASNLQATPSKIPFARKRVREDIEEEVVQQPYEQEENEAEDNCRYEQNDDECGSVAEDDDSSAVWKNAFTDSMLTKGLFSASTAAGSSIPVSVKKASKQGTEIPTPSHKRMRAASGDDERVGATNNNARPHTSPNRMQQSPSRSQSPSRAQSPAVARTKSPSRAQSPAVARTQSPSRSTTRSPAAASSRPQSPSRQTQSPNQRSPAGGETFDCVFSTKSPAPSRAAASNKRNSRKSRSPLADVPFNCGSSSGDAPQPIGGDFAEGKTVAAAPVGKKRRGSLLPRPRANTVSKVAASATEEDQAGGMNTRRSARLSVQPPSAVSIAASTKAAAAAAAVAQAAVGGASGSTASSRRRSVTTSAKVVDENSVNGTGKSSSTLSSKVMDMVHRVTGNGSASSSAAASSGSSKAKKNAAVAPNSAAAAPSNAYDALLSAL